MSKINVAHMSDELDDCGNYNMFLNNSNKGTQS